MKSFFRLLATVLMILMSNGLHLSYTNRQHYRNHVQLEMETDELAKNILFGKRTCGNTDRYKYMEIGRHDAALKAIVLCNIHAREIVTAELCVQWMKQLVNQTKLFNSYFFQVFYEANVNRQTFIRHEENCVRKNENGIDLNRNFPTDFDHYHSSRDNQSYGGERPISQPMTICLNNLINDRNPIVFMDLHTGMNRNAFYQQGFNNEQELAILHEIKDQIVSDLRITTLALDNEPINGHIFADLKARLQIPFSILFETYLKPDNICFYKFNPPAQQKDEYFKLFVRVMNKYLERVIQFSSQK